MDGLLLVDKPAGPTSHEVVACVRRALGERRIGHTGTLDPAATGLLPLVLGRATRLARFLSGHDKSYDAVVRFGVATDTYDGEGTSAGPVHSGPRPAREAVDRALDAFRGTFLQTPPAYSAKKIEGTRSYRLARRAKRERERSVRSCPSRLPPALPARPAPVSVTARAIDIRDFDGDTVSLRVECSAGFYVRSLAHDLGAALGIGAHLTALRRTHSGRLSVDDAIGLDVDPARPGAGARPHDSARADALGSRRDHADERGPRPRRPRAQPGPRRHRTGRVARRRAVSCGCWIRRANWWVSRARPRRRAFCIHPLF